MTILDILEHTWNIGDLDLDMRTEEGKLIKRINVGIEDAGNYPAKQDIIISKPINSYDKNHEYYNNLIRSIPKWILELEITDFRMRKAYRQNNYKHELYVLWANVLEKKIGKIPVEPETKEVFDDSDQMTIEEYLTGKELTS